MAKTRKKRRLKKTDKFAWTSPDDFKIIKKKK